VRKNLNRDCVSLGTTEFRLFPFAHQSDGGYLTWRPVAAVHCIPLLQQIHVATEDSTLPKSEVRNVEVRHWGSFSQTLCRIRGPGSIDGITTGYGLDGPGIESRWGRDFPHLFRPALGPTQPPVQWVPGLSLGVKSGRGVTLAPHPLLVPWSWKSRAIPLLSLWAVRPVQSLSACTRVTFTFTFFYLQDLDFARRRVQMGILHCGLLSRL